MTITLATDLVFALPPTALLAGSSGANERPWADLSGVGVPPTQAEDRAIPSEANTRHTP